MLVDNTITTGLFLEKQLHGLENNKEFMLFEALVRKKDGLDNIFIKEHCGSFLLRCWIIDSVDKYRRFLPEMKALCDLTGARLYMTLDTKSVDKVAFNMMNYGHTISQNLVRNNQVSMKGIMNSPVSISSSSESSVHKKRQYLFDIDTKDDMYLNGVLDEIPENKGHYVFNTPNGWHVTADRFDLSVLSPAVTMCDLISIKENALTIVYYNPKENTK